MQTLCKLKHIWCMLKMFASYIHFCSVAAWQQLYIYPSCLGIFAEYTQLLQSHYVWSIPAQDASRVTHLIYSNRNDVALCSSGSAIIYSGFPDIITVVLGHILLFG